MTDAPECADHGLNQCCLLIVYTSTKRCVHPDLYTVSRKIIQLIREDDYTKSFKRGRMVDAHKWLLSSLLSKFKSSLGFLAVDLLIMWIDVLTVDFV